MSDTDPDLDRLQDLLDAIPAERERMGVAELDGYVAALIVCPALTCRPNGFRGSGARIMSSRMPPGARRRSRR